MTQTAEIRAFLESGGTLTQLESYEFFKCWRLAPRILELRAAGLDIETIIERRGKKRYARYKLRGPVQRSLFAPTETHGIPMRSPAGERAGVSL